MLPQGHFSVADDVPVDDFLHSHEKLSRIARNDIRSLPSDFPASATGALPPHLLLPLRLLSHAPHLPPPTPPLILLVVKGVAFNRRTSSSQDMQMDRCLESNNLTAFIRGLAPNTPITSDSMHSSSHTPHNNNTRTYMNHFHHSRQRLRGPVDVEGPASTPEQSPGCPQLLPRTTYSRFLFPAHRFEVESRGHTVIKQHTRGDTLLLALLPRHPSALPSTNNMVIAGVSRPSVVIVLRVLRAAAVLFEVHRTFVDLVVHNGVEGRVLHIFPHLKCRRRAPLHPLSFISLLIPTAP